MNNRMIAYFRELSLRASAISESREKIRSILGNNAEQRLYDMIKSEANIYDSKKECILLQSIVDFASAGVSADALIQFAIREYKKLICP